MRKQFVLLILIVFSTAGWVFAILPPDASERGPELRARAIKVRKEYAERIEKRKELITREYVRATAAIGVPPWELDRVLNGESEEDVKAAIQKDLTSKKIVKKRILVSIVLLIIIGSAVGWVKHTTREVES